MVRIINPHGTQAVDVWSLAADGSEAGDSTVQYSSMEHTRSVNSSIYVDTGLSVMGMDRRPLFTMVEITPTYEGPGQITSLLRATAMAVILALIAQYRQG